MLKNDPSEAPEKSTRPSTARLTHVRPEVAGIDAILDLATQPAKSVRRPLFRT